VPVSVFSGQSRKRPFDACAGQSVTNVAIGSDVSGVVKVDKFAVQRRPINSERNGAENAVYDCCLADLAIHPVSRNVDCSLRFGMALDFLSGIFSGNSVGSPGSFKELSIARKCDCGRQKEQLNIALLSFSNNGHLRQFVRKLFESGEPECFTIKEW
jgi:hypothetical protein